jgi:hypothetical protein
MPRRRDGAREELRGDVAIGQALPILGERGGLPHGSFRFETDEPALEQSVLELLEHLALASDRMEQLQQQRAQQLLGTNRRPPRLRRSTCSWLQECWRYPNGIVGGSSD